MNEQLTDWFNNATFSPPSPLPGQVTSIGMCIYINFILVPCGAITLPLFHQIIVLHISGVKAHPRLIPPHRATEKESVANLITGAVLIPEEARKIQTHAVTIEYVCALGISRS